MRLCNRMVAGMFIAVLAGTNVLAQVTGTKTIGVEYASLSAALLDLNANGVGAGGVIINVPAGWTETVPARGDSLGSTTLNASTSASNRILIRKSGAGANPLLTAFAPGTSTTTDGIFKIKGTDYVTIDGIDLRENATNTTATQQMEWGYAFVKLNSSAPFDGCQNDTIRNCTVTLARANAASVGIYANNHIANATTSLTITAPSDANSNLSIYGNTMDSCYTGISLTGYSGATSNTSLYDLNNQIGVGGGNTVTNTASAIATTVSYCIMVTQQNNVKINNNTLNGGGATTTTTSGLHGIYANAGLNGEINSNTISIISGAASGTHYGIRCNLGNNAIAAAVTISGNTVQNSYLTTSASSGTLNCIAFTGSCGTLAVTNNTMTNDTIPNNGTGNLNGISHGPSSSVAMNAMFSNNSVNNLRGGGNAAVTNAIVGYNITNAAPGAILSFFGNSAFNLKGNLTSVYGINYVASGNGNTNSIYQNNVYDLATNGIATTVYVMGLKYTTSAGVTGPTASVYNNFFSDLRAPSVQSVVNATGFTGTNPPYSVVGIAAPSWGTAGGTLGLYFNTVYINASSSNTTFGTCGLLLGTGFSADVRNNIVVNLSTPGSTGSTVAHARIDINSRAHPGLTTYLSASNNNNFYVPAAARSYVYGDSTSIANSTADLTIGAYKNRMDPRDLQSFSENPPFINVSTTPYNLHISGTTQVESGGTPVSAPIAIGTDYDGNARNASFPDVGADEFAGTMNDLTPPTILYTAFNTISPTPAHTLVATITDPSGVSTIGAGLPVAYRKINSIGTYATATATSLGSNQYSFTFGSGAAIGDTVFYFVAAQDGAGTPNVGCLLYTGATGFTANPPAAGTPPTSPYWYRIVAAPLSGDYTIGGAGPSYTTINEAVRDLNLRGVGGNVRFLLNAASFTESTPDTIRITSDSITTASKTVTFKPNTGIVATISGIFLYDGLFDVYSPYIIFDGDNGDGLRDLTINNTSAGGPSGALTYVVVLLNGGGTSVPSNCTIKNCNITGGSSTYIASSPTYGVYLNPTGGGYGNIILNNNVITKVQYGISFSGTATSLAANGQITNNTIGSSVSASSVFVQGISATYADNLLISNNEIIGHVAGNAAGGIGIVAGTGCTNTKIRKNRIHDFYYRDASFGSSGTQGIALDPGTVNTGTFEISNNMIYDLKGASGAETFGTATMGSVTQGIWVNSTGTAPVQIYYNTIYLSGGVLGTTASGYGFNGSSACIGIRGGSVGAGTIDIRNNILKNSQTTVDGIPNATDNQTMAIWVQASGSTNAIFGNIDYNDYNIDGNAPQFGWLAGAFSATLPAWRTATGRDVSSAAAAVTFAGATDLHLAGGSIGDHALSGTPIAGITTDFDNQTRDTQAPYMGADEASPALPITLASFAGRVVPNQGVRLDWRTISEINNYGFSVQRKLSNDAAWFEIPNSFIPGHGTTNEPHDYSFLDRTAPQGTLYYRLKSVDLDGTPHLTEPILVNGVTSAEETAPAEFSLKQNYPNPFNPATTIKFALPKQSKVTITIFNVIGQAVATLLEDERDAGFYSLQWSGRNQYGSQVATGLYYYHIEAKATDGGSTFTNLKKMILIK